MFNKKNHFLQIILVTLAILGSSVNAKPFLKKAGILPILSIHKNINIPIHGHAPAFVRHDTLIRDRPVLLEKVVDRPVFVDRQVPVVHEVERLVEKKVPFPVDRPVYIDRPVEVPVEVIKNVPVPVQVPVEVIKNVPYPVERIVQVPVDRIVEKIVDRPVEIIKEVPVDRIVQVSHILDSYQNL